MYIADLVTRLDTLDLADGSFSESEAASRAPRLLILRLSVYIHQSQSRPGRTCLR